MAISESPLARVYLHAWQVTGNDFSRTITEEILDYVMHEMTDPAGGFYSAQDADPIPLRSGDDRSEGEEGKFFAWRPDEIREVLGDGRLESEKPVMAGADESIRLGQPKTTCL